MVGLGNFRFLIFYKCDLIMKAEIWILLEEWPTYKLVAPNKRQTISGGSLGDANSLWNIDIDVLVHCTFT